MSSKKNNNRPSKINASPGAPRKAGSPVEAARKSFVPVAETERKTEIGTEIAPETTSGTAISSRRAAQLERKRKRQRQQIITWSIIGVVLVAVIAGAAFWIVSQGPKVDANGIVTYTGLEQTHVTGKVSYPQSPPVGGPHAPIWQNCGIYDQPIANENGVHALEHGAVWITYQPSLPQATVEQLRAQVRGKGYILLTPYTGLTSPVVASAWGVQLKLDSATDPRLASFISTYRQGPQTPEPGAACTGGVGTPLEL